MGEHDEATLIFGNGTVALTIDKATGYIRKITNKVSGREHKLEGERFPNVVITTKGTVLATWGSKRLRARRSEDGGKTWDTEFRK